MAGVASRWYRAAHVTHSAAITCDMVAEPQIRAADAGRATSRETDVSDGEGTTFLQWRERVQSEVREGEPRLRKMLIVASVVVVLGILVGVIVLLLS